MTDTVDVKVKALAAPKAAIVPTGGPVPQNLSLTLDGSTSTGAAKYEWTMAAARSSPTSPARATRRRS